MNNIKIPFNSIPGFSPIQSDYIEGVKPIFKKAIAFPFNLDSFKNLIDKRRNFEAEKRKNLRELIESQYAQIGIKKDLSIFENPQTFTLTTGHQLNVLTGPAYYIYKIVGIINIAKELKKTYPEYQFLPVFWLASEDHDFDEINHFTLFNKEYSWETNQKGPVGRFNLDGLEEILSQINDLPAFFREAYQKKNMSEAIRYIVYSLFDKYGVICLDADDPVAKRHLIPTIKKEIFEGGAQNLVHKALHQFAEKGYEVKLFPREINFFYLLDGLRERIVEQGGKFRVLNTNLSFSREELEKEIDNFPERFSPNVIFRPIYQEILLPNLSYLGGPGEIAYWLCLKEVFDLHGVSFPLLAPRNSVFYLNEKLKNKFDQLGNRLEFYFLNESKIKERYLLEHSDAEITLKKEIEKIQEIFDAILSKGLAIDKTMEGPINGERQKILNALENLEKKLTKAEERNHEVAINQIIQIKNRLFPQGKWQERIENYLNYALNEPDFIENLVNILDPFDSRVNFISPKNA